MIPDNADTAELIGIAQDAIGETIEHDLDEEDEQKLDEMYLELDNLSGKYRP